MVNGLHLYSAFIQSALQILPLIHPFTHTFTHQRRLAAMQGTNQLVRSNRGLGVLLRDTSTRPGWDRTGNPPTARRQLYLLSHIAPSYIFLISSFVTNQSHRFYLAYYLTGIARQSKVRTPPMQVKTNALFVLSRHLRRKVLAVVA